jgi:hypothetical protein
MQTPLFFVLLAAVLACVSGFAVQPVVAARTAVTCAVPTVSSRSVFMVSGRRAARNTAYWPGAVNRTQLWQPSWAACLSSRAPRRPSRGRNVGTRRQAHEEGQDQGGLVRHLPAAQGAREAPPSQAGVVRGPQPGQVSERLVRNGGTRVDDLSLICGRALRSLRSCTPGSGNCEHRTRTLTLRAHCFVRVHVRICSQRWHQRMAVTNAARIT